MTHTTSYPVRSCDPMNMILTESDVVIYGVVEPFLDEFFEYRFEHNSITDGFTGMLVRDSNFYKRINIEVDGHLLVVSARHHHWDRYEWPLADPGCVGLVRAKLVELIGDSREWHEIK